MTYELYSVEEYRKAFERYSLELACYSSAALLYVDNEDEILEEIYREAEFASALGSKYFHHTFTISLSHTPATLDFDTVLQRVVAMAEKIAEKCRSLGMTALYEPQGAYFNGTDGFLRLCNEMKSRGTVFGVCGDVGNPLFADVTGEAVFERCADRIMHVHVKDYIMSNTPLAQYPGNQMSDGGKHLYDCEIGVGVVNIEACFDILKKVNYDGYFSIELVADDESAARMIEYMKKAYC
jgi:sugar phosphate isomerase/epimerase